MKYIVLIFLLTGCINSALEDRLETLDARVDFYKWEYTAIDCHLNHSICLLKHLPKAMCRDKLEKCELAAYNYYKSVRKAKGE